MFFYKVISALERHGIPYILTGGYAISLHGYVRQTFDIDIIVANDLMTFIEVEHAMNEINLHAQKYSSQSIHKLKEIEKNWIFKNPFDDTEIVDIHVGTAYEKVDTEIKTIQTYKVPIISLEDLIEQKSNSEDPKDIADLRMLKELT